MEDNTKNEDDGLNKYIKSNYDVSVNVLLEEKELKTKWHEEIKENVSMQAYFNKFHPSSIETFIKIYLSNKYFAYKYADNYERRVEENLSRWIDEAHEHLKIILNKKLFDIQCLWRADQIKLEGIRICYDFLALSDNVLDCSFLEPITKDEIKMYQEFLLTSDIDFRYCKSSDFQNYEGFKKSYLGDSDEEVMPDWYSYHNLRTGNTSLLLLPDSRGEKEEFYADLHRKDFVKNRAPIVHGVAETRSFLNSFDKETMNFFVTTFESYETQKKYANYEKLNNNHRNENFELDEILMCMDEEEEYIPIEAHYNYREAIFKAYNSFKLKKLAEYMSLAHEQYLFNQKMGFKVQVKDNFYVDFSEKYIEIIHNGREINGESRDLNF